VTADPASSPLSLTAGRGVLSRLGLRLFERLSGLRQVAEVYEQIPQECSGANFLERVLEILGVKVRVSPEDLKRIPRTGPLLVVANHPYGGIEGVILGHVLASVRPDVKIMANYMLGRVPQLQELMVFVDPFAQAGSARRNLAGLRKTLEWVAAGGALATFPSGEVAHLDLRSRRVVDPQWTPMVARIVRRTGTPVLPVFFCGRNGWLFQTLGLIHPALRTGMLPRELVARRGTTVEMRIGRPVAASKLISMGDDRELIEHLRDRTYLLGRRESRDRGSRVRAASMVLDGTEPVAEGASAEALRAEIDRLPAESLLVSSGGQDVFVAEADRIPGLLHEIGRLRERTFRTVGEGTGQALDLDLFDRSYRHLFIWDRAASELVGAYRLGLTDELLAAEGIEGLYTSTLFRFKPALFSAMGPALEMGRSWVRPKYQRSFASLLLLWKGIGKFVVRHPEYATLFGPVSVSADYQTASQQLIVAFLRENDYVHQWSRWVRPRTPYRAKRSPGGPGPSRLRSLDEVSGFVAELEADEKGVPILLKQYLRLGGRLLGFNVDPDFSNVLDILIAVDLRRTEPRTLVRYMGREGARLFAGHHELERPA